MSYLEIEICSYWHDTFNPLLTNVPLMNKPGSWFLPVKCWKE